MRARTAAAVLAGGLALSGCASVHLPLPRLGGRCQDLSFPVYFAEGSDALTPVAGRAITTAAERTRGCRVGSVHVTGLASTTGGQLANLELSRRRTASVAAALAMNGFPAPAFDLDAEGDRGARLPSGRTALMQRRADVLIHFAR